MFDVLVRCIEDAITSGPVRSETWLEGLNGAKTIGALQRIAQRQGREGLGYLEIGVFRGLTLLSVGMVMDGGFALGIDNFAQFDPEGENLEVVRDGIVRLGLGNVRLLNQDYEDALESLKEELGDRRIGLFFIDGPHDYRSQLMCLLLGKELLSENAVVMVDDCNYRHIRLANRDFLLTNTEFTLLFEAYTKSHPKNMSEAEYDVARQGWWNGVNIIVRDPARMLPRTYPPTHRDRRLYVNEHRVHAAKMGILAPDAVRLAGSIRSFSPLKMARDLAALVLRVFRVPPEGVGRFASLNTYSNDLTEGRFNPGADAATYAGSKPASRG